MRKIIYLIIALPFIAQAQFTFTGGPLNVKGSCKTIWASGDTAYVGFQESLYRTYNGGNSWELLSTGIPADADPRTIEYSSGSLVIGTNNNSRIYTSTNGGDNFTGGTGSITSIFIPTTSSSSPNAMLIGGTNSDPHQYDFSTLDWVSTGNGGITHGIACVGQDTIWECSGSIATGTTRYTYDNGLTWTAVTTEPQTDIGGGVIQTTKAQDFLKVGNRTLVASNLNGFPVLYTDDNGVSWNSSNLGSTSYSDYGKRFLKVNNNHLLTTNLSGLWKSTDQGVTWTLVQSIAGIYTMSLWKTDHVLIGTTQGVFEYDNYGDGVLVEQHGVSASVSNLVEDSNGNLLAATKEGLSRFNINTQQWSLVSDTIINNVQLSGTHVNVINDTIFVSGNGLFTSGDNGQTFTYRDNQAFAFQKPNIIANISGKKLMGTRKVYQGGGTPKTPKIFYSTDDGITYTEATFSNNVAHGFSAVSDNFVEAFLEAGNTIVADMNTGYAISQDGGVNWTYTGDVWSQSIMATKGSSIYHFKLSGIWLDQRSLEISTDDGATWTAVSLNGLPNSGGANYKGFYGVWNVGGEIYTYNINEAPEGLYEYNTNSNSWTLVNNSVGILWEGITFLDKFNGNFFANGSLNGTWSTQATIGLNKPPLSTTIQVYPNPSTGIIQVENPSAKEGLVQVFSMHGVKLYEQKLNRTNTQLDLNHLAKGQYIIQTTRDEKQGITILILE